jgi:hypothetical protein
MLGRIEEDLLEIEPVGLLNLGPLGDRHPRTAQPFGQLVPDTLELAKVEQPGVWSPGGGAGMKPTQAIGGDEGLGELAFEACDLSPQRAPRGQLVSEPIRFADRR